MFNSQTIPAAYQMLPQILTKILTQTLTTCGQIGKNSRYTPILKQNDLLGLDSPKLLFSESRLAL